MNNWHWSIPFVVAGALLLTVDIIAGMNKRNNAAVRMHGQHVKQLFTPQEAAEFRRSMARQKQR